MRLCPIRALTYRQPWRWLVLPVLLLIVAIPARADCSFDAGSRTGIYMINVPTEIENDPGIAVGEVLYTSAPTPIDQRVNFSCSGTGNNWGLVNRAGATPPLGTPMFPIGSTGVSYRVTQKGQPIGPYGGFSLDGSRNWYEEDAVTIELVKTGTIKDGTSVSGTLADFLAGGGASGPGAGQIIDATIQLANRLTFVAPACTVLLDPITVVLPGVATGDLRGPQGSTAGDTPFSIQLQCSKTTNLQISLDADNPVSAIDGVLSAIKGSTTQNVGIQVLHDGQPVALRTSIEVTAAAGSFDIPFSARYYHTKGKVGSGSIYATATYTLSYPYRPQRSIVGLHHHPCSRARRSATEVVGQQGIALDHRGGEFEHVAGVAATGRAGARATNVAPALHRRSRRLDLDRAGRLDHGTGKLDAAATSVRHAGSAHQSDTGQPNHHGSA
jgi:type 1 fimbria pilin